MVLYEIGRGEIMGKGKIIGKGSVFPRRGKLIIVDMPPAPFGRADVLPIADAEQVRKLEMFVHCLTGMSKEV